jgi:hypothetical protein
VYPIGTWVSVAATASFLQAAEEIQEAAVAASSPAAVAAVVVVAETANAAVAAEAPTTAPPVCTQQPRGKAKFQGGTRQSSAAGN